MQYTLLPSIPSPSQSRFFSSPHFYHQPIPPSHPLPPSHHFADIESGRYPPAAVIQYSFHSWQPGYVLCCVIFYTSWKSLVWLECLFQWCNSQKGLHCKCTLAFCRATEGIKRPDRVLLHNIMPRSCPTASNTLQGPPLGGSDVHPMVDPEAQGVCGRRYCVGRDKHPSCGHLVCELLFLVNKVVGHSKWLTSALSMP